MNIEVMTENRARGTNPLQKLAELGQSVWLDYIRESLLSSGELQRLIHDDSMRGITSNPAIFEQAIAASREDADLIGDLHESISHRSLYTQSRISRVEELDQLSINTMRTLAIDAVNAANSGRTRYAPEKFPYEPPLADKYHLNIIKDPSSCLNSIITPPPILPKSLFSSKNPACLMKSCQSTHARASNSRGSSPPSIPTIKDRFEFKTEMDEAARRHMFRHAAAR